MSACVLLVACSSSGSSTPPTESGGATATGGATTISGGANGGFASGGATSTGNGGTSAGGASANGGASTMGASGGATANGGASGSGGTVAGATGGTTATRPDGGVTGSGCGAGDPKLPSEPSLPAACATLTANKASANDALAAADETSADTASIHAALDACPSGQAVRLTASGSNDAFLSGPLSLDGKTLWVDSGVTLFASRNPRDYDTSSGACGVAGTSNGCKPFIAVTGKGAGIVGDGIIDGRGGEPMLGSSKTWWDVSNSTTGSYSNPRLVQVTNAQDFTLYRITLHDSPNFHVVIGSQGFVVWGVTVVTPWKTVNSAGTKLTPVYARNTDGIDPAGASNGFVVCSKISDGDDQMAIKGGSATSHLVVAHDRFGAGHGMSIGSETNGGVSDIDVYDLSIDGS
ncbi:MAG TPA: glycosyl hydrolase family 28 protein, partial [Polyangiaceae bacterium]|nr:glycosyl hydrolase family 28 protein [Polyangiaceae bacterium]